jgi:hypothetical protein
VYLGLAYYADYLNWSNVMKLRIKKSAGILVRVNEISFRTTAAAIRDGVGTSSEFNIAARAALLEFEVKRQLMYKKDGIEIRGILGTWNGYIIQLDLD